MLRAIEFNGIGVFLGGLLFWFILFINTELYSRQQHIVIHIQRHIEGVQKERISHSPSSVSIFQVEHGSMLTVSFSSSL